MVDKMLKGAFALILLIVVVSVILVLVEPFLPYIGIAIAVVMFLAASIFIIRLAATKRKFW